MYVVAAKEHLKGPMGNDLVRAEVDEYRHMWVRVAINGTKLKSTKKAAKQPSKPPEQTVISKGAK